MSCPEQTSGLGPSRLCRFRSALRYRFLAANQKLGPSKAYQLVCKHGTIEQILEAIETQPRDTLKVSRDVYLAQIQIAREVFGTLLPVPPVSALEAGKKSDEDITETMGLGLRFWTVSGIIWLPTIVSLVGTFEDDPRAL